MVRRTSRSMRLCASPLRAPLSRRSASPAPSPVAPPLTASEAPAISSGADTPAANDVIRVCVVEACTSLDSAEIIFDDILCGS